MTINGLDHINLNPADMDACLGFYVGILGLTNGDRPPFDTPGAWLYAGDRAIIHLAAGRGNAPAATGAIDHIALGAEGLAGMLARLTAAGIDFETFTVPGRGLKQVFLTDPDGVRVELTFESSEAFPDD